MIPLGLEFYKLSGSGNDFVFVDTRTTPPGPLVNPEVIGRICSHGTGIGADGIVFLEPSSAASVKLVYINADGTRADLCGNATLCTARLARELGVVGPDEEFSVETDVGVLAARFRDGRPEIDLHGVSELRPDAGIPTEGQEQRIGFAMAGVPHLVILVPDVSMVDVVGRGRPLRHHRSLRAGANVNFVQRLQDGSFSYRTYERGVEAETLACGTGAVATGALLTRWGFASGPVRLKARSGRELAVRFERANADGKASLSGEARIVFYGRFGEVPGLGASS